jgi:hypothetical protein
VKALVDMICNLLDEGEQLAIALRKGIIRGVIAGIIIVVAGLVVLAALGFVLYGVYWYLAAATSPGAGALITGAIAFVAAMIAVAFGWLLSK